MVMDPSCQKSGAGINRHTPVMRLIVVWCSNQPANSLPNNTRNTNRLNRIPIHPHSTPEGSAHRRLIRRMSMPRPMPITHHPSNTRERSQEPRNGSSRSYHCARAQSVGPPTALQQYRKSWRPQRVTPSSLASGDGASVVGCVGMRGAPMRNARRAPERRGGSCVNDEAGMGCAPG